MLRFNIKLTQTPENLFLFMGEVHRLCNGQKSFIFCFKNGKKLYLETCNGLQRKAYICPEDLKSIKSIVSTMNYAVALQAQLNLSLNYNILFIDISSDNLDTMNKICSFSNSLGLECSIK